MAWLVVAMGVLLMLVGAIAVNFGAPIIQLERGWAEVISGSVAASGGVIAFALGLVLFRLQSLQQTIAARTFVTPAAQAAFEPAEVALRPTHAPGEIVHMVPEPQLPEPPLPEPRDEVRDEAAHPNLWKAVPTALSLRPTIAPVPATVAAAGLAAAADESASEASPMPDLRPQEVREPEPASPRTEERTRRLTFPPSERTEAADPTRRPPTLSRDWMSRPLLRPRPPQPPPATEPPPLFAGPTGDLDDDRVPEIDTPARIDDVQREASAPRLDIEPTQPAPPAPPELSVVGRYQAGSSTYTMYSNGSIDVETQAGDIHHFTSMDELKAFIARQDNAVS